MKVQSRQVLVAWIVQRSASVMDITDCFIKDINPSSLSLGWVNILLVSGSLLDLHQKR